MQVIVKEGGWPWFPSPCGINLDGTPRTDALYLEQMAEWRKKMDEAD
jgi:hypothetical protein